MAVIAPQGIGFVDKHDLNHQTVTPEDTEVIAGTIVARLRERSTELGELRGLVDALLAASGLTVQSPVDGQTAALVQQQGSLTAVAIRALMGEHLVGIRADAYGMVGDGVTDDTAALHAAAAAAAQAGLPLVIPGGMSVGISSYTRFPAGLTLHTNGSKFTQLSPMGRAPVVGLGPRSTVVGGLLVDTLGGDACQGVHIGDAPDVTIDHLEVTSAVPGAGKGNVRDNGLRVINSPGLRIGRARIVNYDWGAWLEESQDAHIGHIEVDTYSLAVRVKGGCSGLRIFSGWTYTAGPNSSYLPGYNGLLMENQSESDDLRIENFTVEDAGEHGVRVSGLTGQSNISFTNCTTRNCGGSGFKVLGGDSGESTFRNSGVTFTNCKAIDSGSINQNCCGFLIQRAARVTLIAPEVSRLNKTYSAVEGIRMSGVQYVTVESPRIMDTHKFGIHIDEASGNVQDVTFNNLHISSATGHGIYLQNPGVEFRDMRFQGFVEIWGTSESAGVGFYAGRYTAPEDSGTWRGMNALDITFSDSTGATRQISTSSSETALAAFTADLTMWRGAEVAPSWPPFAGGSMVLDRRLNTRQIMKGGVWVSV